jgi:hypothetical protein
LTDQVVSNPVNGIRSDVEAVADALVIASGGDLLRPHPVAEEKDHVLGMLVVEGLGEGAPSAVVVLTEETRRGRRAGAESGDGERGGKGKDETLSHHLFS